MVKIMKQDNFLHKSEEPLKNKNPLVSIIIPAYNEEEVIENCIKTLKNQTYKKIEIIFVDDGSTDRTLEIVNRFEEVKILKQNHQGPGNARNLGAKNAKGEILSFVDADMTFDKNFIQNLIKPIIEENEIGTIDGVQIALNQNNIWSKCWGRYFIERKSEYGWVYRAMMKSEFIKMGGFDSSLGYADDRTFFIKYNARSKRVKDAICYHKNAETLKEVFKQSVWIGSSINQKWIKIRGLNFLMLIGMMIIFPIAIIPISINKSHKIKNFKILFPWMIIFISVRYAGMLKGIYRRIFYGWNFR